MPPKRATAGDAPASKKTKAAKVDDVPAFDERWKTQKPSIIYIGDDLDGKPKIAAFDMDSTLIERKKDAAPFSLDPDSWLWYDDTVPTKLRELHKDGYKLVIFSNQASIKSALNGKGASKLKAKIDAIIKAAEVPMAAFCATQKDDDNRKPGTGMWDLFIGECNGGVEVNKEDSFFVGDAAGREYDIADTDIEFAKAVGLPFKTVEDFFGPGRRPNRSMARCLQHLSQRILASGADDKAGFKARALNRAATTIETHEEKITSGKEAMKLPGVGKGTRDLIDEFLETGKMGTEDDGKKEDAAAAAAKNEDDGDAKDGAAPGTAKGKAGLAFVD